jgi:predicted HTH transcriptional regulator
MKKYTKHSVQWLYSLLERGECDFIDFKEQIGDKTLFGKSQKNFSASYDDLARDVVAFANRKGGFICIGVVDQTKELNPTFTVTDEQTFQLIRQIQDRTQPTITLIRHLMKVDGGEVLVLEVPFSQQLHRTSKANT